MHDGRVDGVEGAPITGCTLRWAATISLGVQRKCCCLCTLCSEGLLLRLLESMTSAQSELCTRSDSLPHAGAKLAARKDTRKREKNVVGRLDDVSCGEKQIARERGH